jgi:N-acetylglutamate synthase-like GNAT family acetyltransferase
MEYQIIVYTDKYQQAIVDLILPIQQNEFHVPVTIEDQPDLKNIPGVYQKGNGNFWLAVKEGEVVGTIALIDFGNSQVALRKMFVHHDHRGKDKGVGQMLMDELLKWCKNRGVREIYLGTIDSMHAAHRFYLKNSFEEVSKSSLPQTFPLMRVDNKFFKCVLK